ncbi:MAG TPA: SRPBCC family protein [Puia sp.]|nr:SRPBCC family protein [Puia sp.]
MQTSSTIPAAKPDVNMGDRERLLSGLAGSLLIYATVRKHTVNTLLLLGGGYLLYRAVSGHCAVYDAISRQRTGAGGGDLKVRTHVVVNRPRTEVYAFWRRLENWPLFMRHLEHIDELDGRTSVWRLKMPGGMEDIRWEARIVKEEKDIELSWHSVEGAVIRNTGKINFSDTPGKGTRIDVMIVYGIPAGPIGERIAGLLTPAFRRRVEEDIHQYKEYLETETNLHAQ